MMSPIAWLADVLARYGISSTGGIAARISSPAHGVWCARPTKPKTRGMTLSLARACSTLLGSII
jgi:hypothetical protein